MKNGRGEKAKGKAISVARIREKVRAPPQFRVNECGARHGTGEHARVRPSRKGETKRDG